MRVHSSVGVVVGTECRRFGRFHLSTVVPFADRSPGDARVGEIRAEQTKVVYRYLPPLLAINAAVASGMVYGLWDVVERRLLIGWSVAMLAVIVLRAILYAAYHHDTRRAQRSAWGLRFTLGSGASGVLWGAAGVVLFPGGSLEYQLFILFVLVGMGAGAISSLTAYKPAFLAYFPISMLPVCFVLFAINDPIHIGLGVMTAAYIAALTFFGSTINKALVESLSLRFANVDLVNQLSAQRDEAERANIGKSKFLAAASHDLRQPLHALTLFTTALDERIRYPETRRIVDNINAAVRALEKLFNALLDISRLDAGVLQAEPRDFRLDEMLVRLVSEYSAEANAKGLTLRYEPATLAVYSDPALLERIVRNYLSNALRYTDRGGVRVVAMTRGDEVRIDVIDTGVGVPPSQHEAIFDEFYQLGNRERDRAKGLGLGLAIVKRVAWLLGAAIEVESESGRGARFSVTVPLGHAAKAARADSASAAADSERSDVADLCVAVVDDEASIREGMVTLLEHWGCRVFAAGTAAEAVAALRTAGAVPDVLVVDYRLRDDRTGVDAIEEFREAFAAAMPALIVTGDTAPERLREAKSSGYPLVHKPLQPALLRAFLRNTKRKLAAR